MTLKKALLYFTIFLLWKPVCGQQNTLPIDTTLTLDIDGIKQVVALKGEDRGKPVLLYLHGAAGNNFSLIANADKLTSRLQKYFVVALWDQRDYGKTFQLNKSNQPLTLQLIEEDAKNVVDSLRRKLNRNKIYIAAHSMGCVLGIDFAQKHPESIYALIEMSPPVNGIESQSIRLTVLKNYYNKINKTKAINELATVKLPARDFQSLFILYVWQTEYEGEHISDSVREQLRPVLKSWMETSAASLSNEIFEMNFAKQFPVLNCPIYFFAGRKDFITNATLTEKYYQQLKAPKKQLYWFEKSAHAIPDTEPERMQDIIINDILPATKK